MLQFKPIDIESLKQIDRFLQFQKYRTCDYTIGGLFMWADYFKYEYTVCKETLFIKGVSESDLSQTAFSLPIGLLDDLTSLNMLREYCKKENYQLILSAVPEHAFDLEKPEQCYKIQKLENWSDYLYDINQLATLSGKKFNKKRNHVNNFKKNYPSYEYERINQSNISSVIDFFNEFKNHQQKDDSIFLNELTMTDFVLNNYAHFDPFFIGALIKVNNKVIAYSMGEIVNDTLYIHIEKADTAYSGIYETLTMHYVADIRQSFNEVHYVNREEDVGDEGLKKSKLSYNPIAILNKYNIACND